MRLYLQLLRTSGLLYCPPLLHYSGLQGSVCATCGLTSELLAAYDTWYWGDFGVLSGDAERGNRCSRPRKLLPANCLFLLTATAAAATANCLPPTATANCVLLLLRTAYCCYCVLLITSTDTSTALQRLLQQLLQQLRYCYCVTTRFAEAPGLDPGNVKLQVQPPASFSLDSLCF